MKKVLFSFVLLFISCDFVASFKNEKQEIDKVIVASVFDENLYLSDIESVIPKNMTDQDSLVFVKNYINTWAKQQLLLGKAEENISSVNNKRINDLVKDYREGLYINGYKDKLVKQQLDTVVSKEDVEDYYQKNIDNFLLNKELIQLKYVYFGKDFIDKNDVVKKFKSDKEEDLEDLEALTINFKDFHLRDSTWLTLEDVVKKIPLFQSYPKEKVLKISKFIQEEDSLGVYLVAVNDVLNKNEKAPLSYISPQVKQIILHKRKLELIKEIEKTLINDAIKNESFKIY